MGQWAQQFRHSLYPALMRVNRWMGAGSRVRINKSHTPPKRSIYELEARTLRGERLPMSQLKGRYLLLVNTASECGYTPQFAELEHLQQEFPETITVMGFPSNDFGGQEPNSNEQIEVFCRTQFHISFPMMARDHVTGPEQQSVYRWLTDPAQNGWNSQAPQWNFCKYLISPEGSLLAYFPSGIAPDSETITRHFATAAAH